MNLLAQRDSILWISSDGRKSLLPLSLNIRYTSLYPVQNYLFCLDTFAGCWTAVSLSQLPSRSFTSDLS